MHHYMYLTLFKHTRVFAQYTGLRFQLSRALFTCFIRQHISSFHDIVFRNICLHCGRIALYLVIKLLRFGHFDLKNDPDRMLQVRGYHKRINTLINIFM